MYNLLKSDLYRLVHGKMLWVALGCLVVLAAGSGWFVWFGTTLPGASTTSELAWDSRTHTYAQLLIEGGVLPIIVSIMVALLFAGDYETGFAKSVFAGRPRRAPYFVERLALCGLLCAAFLLAGAFVADASFAVFGSAYQRVETVGEYWTWLGLAWLEAVARAHDGSSHGRRQQGGVSCSPWRFCSACRVGSSRWRHRRCSWRFPCWPTGKLAADEQRAPAGLRRRGAVRPGRRRGAFGVVGSRPYRARVLRRRSGVLRHLACGVPAPGRVVCWLAFGAVSLEGSMDVRCARLLDLLRCGGRAGRARLRKGAAPHGAVPARARRPQQCAHDGGAPGRSLAALASARTASWTTRRPSVLKRSAASRNSNAIWPACRTTSARRSWARGYLWLAQDEQDEAGRARRVDAAIARLDDTGGLLDQLLTMRAPNDPDIAPMCGRWPSSRVGRRALGSTRPSSSGVSRPSDSRTKADGGRRPQALARVFENLIDNALRHGSSAPTIEQRGRTVTFANEVADPDAVDASRLFERFYRGDASRSTPGTGLGLAVAASLANAMGMRLGAQMRSRELLIELALPGEEGRPA
ncbi:MAG: ATP-binding protein [Eggerthellaceae bacterium]